MRTKYSHGFPIQVWHKPDGARNEPLDCRVYAYAALQGLVSMGLLLNKVAANMLTRLEAAKERFEEVKAVNIEPETPRPMIHRPPPKRRTVIRSGYMS
jgi:phage terminase large subunit GpA-like protein